MFKKCVLFGLIIIKVIQLCVGCDRPASICEKYCEIERTTCAGLKHPLCTTFNSSNLDPSFGEVIVNIDQSDVRNTILFEINRFRNDLAYGYVNNKRAANLQVVKWSFDLQLILETKLQYENVCSRITSDNTKFVQVAAFNVFKKDYFYQLTELTTTIKSSYQTIKWKELFDAEFNEIGCVMTEMVNNYTLKCLTNTKYSENMTFDLSSAYKIGEPCGSCKCSEHWMGLCDHDGTDRADSHHDDDTNDDMIVLYIMILIVIILIVIIVGFVCLCLFCIDCVSQPDEKGTYILRNKFNSQQRRGTLFEK